MLVRPLVLLSLALNSFGNGQDIVTFSGGNIVRPRTEADTLSADVELDVESPLASPESDEDSFGNGQDIVTFSGGNIVRPRTEADTLSADVELDVESPLASPESDEEKPMTNSAPDDDGNETTPAPVEEDQGDKPKPPKESGEKRKPPPDEPAEEEEISYSHMNDDCKCEEYLHDPIFYYLARYGVKFPSWCCIFAALARTHKKSYETYSPGEETEPQAPSMDALADVASVIINSGMKTLHVSSTDALIADMKKAFPDDLQEEYGYGCDYDFLTCKLIFAIYRALEQGINACYCHYRSKVGCECDSCKGPDYGIDEKVAFFFGILPKKNHRRELEELMMDQRGLEIADKSSTYTETLIKTCTQCPDKDGGMPYEKCYGYCLILEAYPFMDKCLPADRY